MRKPARLIAYYLPQYHPIPENDRWWGKGFTEWTNVTRAKPLFEGHYQPRLPADLGFYDLRLEETRIAQAEMARNYGIEGFCYWHYWFGNGKRLLERPFNEVVLSGRPNFPFCLAWANESWTGIWHGSPDRILQEQTYPGRQDYEEHFRTLLPAFTDERYITVDGKPIFVIYRPHKLPEPRKITDIWREMAVKHGLNGLYFIGETQTESWMPNKDGFDAMIIAHQTRLATYLPRNPFKRYYRLVLRHQPIGDLYAKLRRRPVHVYTYQEAMQHFIVQNELKGEYFPCLIPGWDNTPRSGLRGVVLRDSTPELFRQQVRTALRSVSNLRPEHRIVFIKSWNEWAEGNYMEPDMRFGRAYLDVTIDELQQEFD